MGGWIVIEPVAAHNVNMDIFNSQTCTFNLYLRVSELCQLKQPSMLAVFMLQHAVMFQATCFPVGGRTEIGLMIANRN